MERPPVFLFGSPRSGTTWLQRMLGAHPAIATPQELHLLTRYLGDWPSLWADQLPEDRERWRRRRYNGLPALLGEEEFLALGRSVVESVHACVLAGKPGAAIVLEKDAGYQAAVPWIVRLFPEARLVHLVRDGRDVAASLLSASRGWGRGWAPATAGHAAWMWREAVRAGRAAAALTEHYLELRFEDLHGESGPEELARALAFCGAETTPEQAREIHERYTRTAVGGAVADPLVWGGEVVRRLGERPVEPEGFLGESRAGAWRERLGAFDRWSFAREAGPLLTELGYADDASWVAPGAWRVLGPPRRALTASVVGGRFAAGAAREAVRIRPTARLAR